MPPLPEEEEASSGEDVIPSKKATKEVAEDESEDESGGEDEFVIEKILSHDWNASGDVVYEVKWEGYEAVADRTWEPEENLESARETLEAYWKKHGKPTAREPSKKGKKRKTEDTSTPKGGRPKRAKEETPELSAKKKAKAQKEPPLPKGTWENDVASVDTIEEALNETGSLQRYVFVLWDDGRKTRHAIETVNEKCPKKMLRYYESHLVFRTPDNGVNGDTVSS